MSKSAGKFSWRLWAFIVAATALTIVIPVVCLRCTESVNMQADPMNVAEEKVKPQVMDNKGRIDIERRNDSDQSEAIEHFADSDNLPSYTDSDVVKMVKRHVPAYSRIELWRQDNDNWLMRYMREYGGKEHWFMRRFNPTSGRFEKEREYGTVTYKDSEDIWGSFKYVSNAGCRFSEYNRGADIIYSELDVDYGLYSQSGIREICRIVPSTVSPMSKLRIKALEASQEDEEDYEAWEDYYEDYDNADADGEYLLEEW